jgi:hypothetical protein
VLLRHGRFTVPSFHLVAAVDEAIAQEIADELLDDYIAVEVWEGDRRLYVRESVGGEPKAPARGGVGA